MSVCSCAIGKSLKRVRDDWKDRYINLLIIEAVVSWADNTHHEGTIYKASNFKNMGKSGGSLHGNRKRPTGGQDKLHEDYKYIKTKYFYFFNKNNKLIKEKILIKKIFSP